MAAEDAQSTSPAANGDGPHTEVIAADIPTDSDVAQTTTQSKLSAAEKRRQRKKKNKQTKQAERQAPPAQSACSAGVAGSILIYVPNNRFDSALYHTCRAAELARQQQPAEPVARKVHACLQCQA